MKFRRTAGHTSAEMPFLDHLEELRWRILWSLLAILLCSMGAFVAVVELGIIGWLIEPIMAFLPDGKLIYLAPTDSFFITFKLALAIGLILASPIVFYHVWSFLSPALLPHEKRAIVPALYLGLVLFAGGVALAYYVALPFSLTFLLGFQTEHLTPSITANAYFSFVTRLLLAFGVVFEMPVVIMVLAAIGLVTSAFLRSKRRYAFAGMAILSAMITPGDAITATVVLLGPLFLLYELSILLAKIVEKRSVADRASDPMPEPS